MEIDTTSAPLTIKQRLGQALFARMPITRFLFEQIRMECRAGYRHLTNVVVPSRRAGLLAVRAARGVRANVACGPFVIDGFINLDLCVLDPRVIGYDCRRGVPLADEAAAGIRVEHFVEHLEPRQELPAFFKDCHRALQPGCTLQVIVPDAGRFLRAYCREDNAGFSGLGFPRTFS